MTDQNGTRNPWDSNESQNAWNPSGAPLATGSENTSEKAENNDSVASSEELQTSPDAPATPATPAAPTTQLPAANEPSQSAAPTTRFSPTPEYGANTDNPTEPLSAASYPFGAPENLDSQKTQALNQQNGQFGQQSQGGPQNGASGPNNGAGNPGNQGGFFSPFGAGSQQGQQNSGTPGNGGQSPFFGAPFGSGNAGSQGPQGPQSPQGPNGPKQGGPNGGPNNGGKPVAKQSTLKTWIIAVAAAIIAALLVVGLAYAGIANGIIALPQSSSLSSLNSSSSGSGTAKAESGDAVDWSSVNQKVAKSVVSISAEVSGGVAKGSGAIIDTDGNIVTNNHVIEGASQIQVTLSDGTLYAAKLVGTDATTDLAVIKLESAPSNLQAVDFADSANLAVGEGVMAIGNPLGYENTATTGIVSALNRPVSVTDESSNADIVTNAIQIDASINPGNSGGPTFNAAGQVVGINSSIATASTSSSSESSSESGSIGIGFAIPSNLVKRVAQQIVESGKATHAQLGVSISSGTATADNETRAGAKVVSVVSGGPAEKAGLKEGDVIVGFNGDTVSSMYSVLGYVRAAAVGDTVKLTVIRSSKVLDVNVTLTEAESTSSYSSDSGNSNNNNDNNNGDGESGNGDSGNGNSGNGNDDSGNGGFSDPFGLFGGQ